MLLTQFLLVVCFKIASATGQTRRAKDGSTSYEQDLASTGSSSLLSLAITTGGYPTVHNSLCPDANRSLKQSTYRRFISGSEACVAGVNNVALWEFTLTSICARNASDFELCMTAYSYNYCVMESLVRQQSPSTQTTSSFALVNGSMMDVRAVDLGSNLPLKATVGFSVDVSKDQTFKNEVVPYYNNKAQGGGLFFRQAEWFCAFYDQDTGQLSSKGCSTVQSLNCEKVTCQCNSTGMYTAYLSVDALTHSKTITIITSVGSALSICFLLVTFVVLVSVRNKVKSDRTFVQINLVLALVFFHTCELLKRRVREVPALCAAVTVSTHFFILSSVFWMLVEGLTLAGKASSKSLQLLAAKRRKLNACRFLVGWGIPFMLVSTSAVYGLTEDIYLHKIEEFCSEAPLVLDSGFRECRLGRSIRLWVAALPIGLCAVLNLAVLLRVVDVSRRLKSQNAADFLHRDPKVCKRRRDLMAKVDEAAHAIKLLMVLLPVLGVAMPLTFFICIGSRSFELPWICIELVANRLQGVYVFTIYCLLGTDVRQAAVRMVRRTLNRGSH